MTAEVIRVSMNAVELMSIVVGALLLGFLAGLWFNS